MARILVVDDTDAIAELVSLALQLDGHDVAVAHTGREATELVASFRPQLVVLDVMLPDADGFTIHRRLRDAGETVPVVFVTARDSVDDKVTALRAGGDDYITKPFVTAELVARIDAVLRRATPTGGGDTSVVHVGPIELRRAEWKVFVDGTEVALTPTEFRLLEHLCLTHPRVATRSQILDVVWEYDIGGDSGIVEQYVSYLRRKLGTAGTWIRTVRGVGYGLASV